MQPGDLVLTPRGEGVAERFAPYRINRFGGRPQTIVFVFVRYRNDVVQIHPISEITPIETGERVES